MGKEVVGRGKRGERRENGGESTQRIRHGADF